VKHQFVADLAAGVILNDRFVVTEKIRAQKKNGEAYLSLSLLDRTGEIKGVVWDDVDRLDAVIAPKRFFQIEGNVTEYRGNLQVTVKSASPVDREAVDLADFLPRTRRDPDKMLDRLKRHLSEGIADPHITALMTAFWDDDAFVRSFKSAPGAKKMHHAYIGGLLEHTLSMTLLVQEVARHYSGLDMEILLAGAFLHDLEKIREFTYDTHIDYSDEGRLVTHIVIGVGILDEKIRQVPGFPDETAFLLKHMIVSHHGSREFGSPEPPRTIEAVLLNHIDDIDAKMNGLREFIVQEGGDEPWTPFNRMLGRHLYKGRKPEA